MEFKHKSVLLNETIDGLRVKPDGIYVDGKKILNFLMQKNKLSLIKLQILIVR